jgi:recombinational DNA repair ATPase RecF
MATPTEAQKTNAIKNAVMELLDPDNSGNRTERSILETLYPMLTKSERRDVLDGMARQGYNRAEVAKKMNDYEEDHFGVRGNYS